MEIADTRGVSDSPSKATKAKLRWSLSSDTAASGATKTRYNARSMEHHSAKGELRPTVTRLTVMS